MEHYYNYQQRRSRSQPRIPQQPSPAYRSSDLDYPVSGTGGNYFGASGSAGYFGGENRPWRSRSLDNRRDWVVSNDYGFPAAGADDRYIGGTLRYQSQHQQQHRNYDYQPYLSVSTAPSAGYRSTYDGRRGNDPYFDNATTPYSPRSIPAESDWDALDRSIRNYREDPGAAHVAATMRRSKAQSLSPNRPGGFFSGGAKSRQRNVSSFFHRQTGVGGGTSAPQNNTPEQRSESMLRYRSEYPGGAVAREEIEFGGEQGGMSNYYRGGSSSHQQQEIYGPDAGPATSGTIRGRATRGGVGGNMRYGPDTQKYYKLRCCCLTFRWPPWALEEVEPPQPMYRRT